MFAGLFIKTCLQKKAEEVTVSAALIFKIFNLASQKNKINKLYNLKAI